MKLHLATMLLMASATTLSAQQEERHEAEHKANAAEHQMMDHGLVKSITPIYTAIRGFLIKSAEQMPESDYGFKPTPDVRSFGELIGHVANASYLFCSGAMGEKSPAKADYEKTVTSKAGLVEGLKAGLAYCDKAYEMSDMKSVEKVTFFGTENTRLWVLNFNVAHDAEHYGNIVTYMRLKGMVPPSSQGGQ